MPGGTIILVGPCPEGIGVTHPRQVDYLAMEPADLLHAIATGQVDDPIAAAVCAKVALRQTTGQGYHCLRGLAGGRRRRMGFAHCDSLPRLWQPACASYGQDTKVAVITHGGETVPYVAEEQGGESRATVQDQ